MKSTKKKHIYETRKNCFKQQQQGDILLLRDVGGHREEIEGTIGRESESSVQTKLSVGE